MLSQENQVNLYRIIQEIIHNTIKHSKAKNLIINIRRTDDHITLASADDGAGFIYEPSKDGATGLGLLNIQSRAAILKAKLIVQTQPSKGTKYFISIPLVI